GLWKPMPEEYAVGFAGTYRNTNGGVSLGYGYRQDGTLDSASCEASLWTTGQSLRNNPALRSQLEPGGPLLVNGLQGSPPDMVRRTDEPPAISYFVDYDDKFDDPRASGHLGSVRIRTLPCAGAIAVNASSPSYVSGTQSGGGSGCVGPNCGPPPPPKACFASTGTFECVNGQWIYKLTVMGPGWINSVNAHSLTPGVTVSGGSFPLNPASIPVSGAPGSTATIEICAFNAAAAAGGKPYDCCRTKVTVTIPTRTCGGIK
ncbi:MAG: hypothetical protein Q8K85_08215, partial [Hyphomicrobium sp.]|nr:hypothetical protein [Hyphomicrobium sp.]